MSTDSKLSAESFLGLVRQSNLVDPELLKRTWIELQERGAGVGDSGAIADELVARAVLTRWQADKLLQRKHKGFFLGRYRLLSHLGTGGMSAVYLAEHTLMRRRVAIKVLPQARIADSSYLERFHREARAVAALDHRNIVRAYDVDQEGNVHFLVMEFVAGRNLNQTVIANGPLDCVAAVEYARQAAEGLHQAHRASMVHRDVKPSNLLLNEKGTVKLLDLGLARFFNEADESSLTIQHDVKILGTADFLSPEQALDSHKVDVRSDIYSLGCTLYFLLAGHPPYPEGTLAQRLLAHQSKPPYPIRTTRPDIPESLVNILDKMMAKQPQDRYQTAADAGAVMLQWLMVNGGAAWLRMNPVVPASGSPVSSADATNGGPPSNRSTSEPASPTHATADEETGVGPENSSTTPASRIQEAAGDAEDDPELAAFLSNLALEKHVPPGATKGREPRVEQGTVRQPEKGAIPRQGSRLSSRSPASPTKSSRSASLSERESSRVESPVQPGFVYLDAVDGKDEPQPMAIPGEIYPSADALSEAPASLARTAPQDGGRWRTLNRSAAAASAIVLLAIVGYFAFVREKVETGVAIPVKPDGVKTDPPKKSPTGRPVPVRRELKVGGSGDFATIGAALADARQNFNKSRKAMQIIRVAAGRTYAERIVIDETFPRGIQIVAEEGSPAVLAPTGPDPIVVIRGGKKQVEDFVLEGFHLDAGGKDVAVQLADWTLGTKLKGLRIGGFTRAGVLIDSAQTFGAEDARIVLDEITFHDGGPQAGGILFQRRTEDPMHVRVQQCRFLTPLAAGIKVDSGAIDLEILESIFYRTQTGVQLAGADRTWRDVVLAYNTFYENDRAVVFTNMPGASSSGFGFYNNLFVGSRTADAVIEKDYNVRGFMSMYRTSPGGHDYNWTTRPRAESAGPGAIANLFETVHSRAGVENLQFQSLDPESRGFLAPGVGSPQRRVGTILDRKKYGEQIGAVR